MAWISSLALMASLIAQLQWAWDYDIEALLTSNSSASSPAVRDPPCKSFKIWRRVGSEIALKMSCALMFDI